VDEPTRGGDVRTVVVSVPAMSSPNDLRLISAQICDLGGVVAVEVGLDAKTIRVHGAAGIAEVCAAIARAGYVVAD